MLTRTSLIQQFVNATINNDEKLRRFEVSINELLDGEPIVFRPMSVALDTIHLAMLTELIGSDACDCVMWYLYERDTSDQIYEHDRCQYHITSMEDLITVCNTFD